MAFPPNPNPIFTYEQQCFGDVLDVSEVSKMLINYQRSEKRKPDTVFHPLAPSFDEPTFMGRGVCYGPQVKAWSRAAAPSAGDWVFMQELGDPEKRNPIYASPWEAGPWFLVDHVDQGVKKVFNYTASAGLYWDVPPSPPRSAQLIVETKPKQIPDLREQ